MASVDFVSVGKVYPGGAVGLEDFSLGIGDGELVVVVGPSGCGKSTVLRLLAGLEEPSAGELRIDGRNVNLVSPQERNVAMVFQDYALYPHLRVRGNLEFPLRMRRIRRDEMNRRVEQVAALLDIAALLDRLPKQLSGGQRQRVAMGRALVREPSVFLLDEPLSNLDAKLRVQVRAEIADLQQRTRTTMLYVTHDQVEAMTLGERVAVMNRGRLQQFAPPRDLYERPSNVFVAGFIGTPPMNLFPTRVAVDGDSVEIAIGGGRVRAPRSALRVDLPTDIANQPLTAGLRPEALRLADRGSAGSVEATVEQVEPLGHESLVHARVSGPKEGEPVRLIARVAGMPELAKGDAVRLDADLGGLHLFDRNGNAVLG